jgi:hypothetical protein
MSKRNWIAARAAGMAMVALILAPHALAQPTPITGIAGEGASGDSTEASTAAGSPTFSPKPGTYSSAQAVALSSATPKALIYYTTNGSTPTTSSTKYSADIKVSATTTIKAIAVASGYTDSAVASGTYTITPPPSALSYPASPPLLIGNEVSLSPKVTGKVAAYAVSPTLPDGLSINVTTGVISGKPTKATAEATYTVSASNVSGATHFALVLTVNPGPTVHVVAAATDPNGHSLSYQWQATDGKLLNTSEAQTDWMLPPGTGIHFAYVMVSNGKGGFTQARVAVNTGEFGAVSVTLPTVAYAPPPSSVPDTVPVRAFLTNAPSVPYPATVNVAAAGVTVDSYLDSFESPLFATKTTDGKGSVTFQNVPLNANLLLYCQMQFIGGFTPCGPTSGYLALSSTPSEYSIITFPLVGTTAANPAVFGRVSQQDGTAAGVTEPFFGLNVPVTVALTYPNCAAGMGCISADVDDFNDFTVGLGGCDGGSRTLTASIQDATPVSLSIPCTSSTHFDGTSVGTLTLPGTGGPKITALTASYNGKVVGTLLPKAALEPSDSIPQQDFFLAFKGTDDRLRACKYYEAIGAVPSGGCDSSGNYTAAISLEEWQRVVQIDNYAPSGTKTYTANYVNVVDLNLARGHHSVSHPDIAYGPNSVATAAYVCNHPGPVDNKGNPLTVNLPASTMTAGQQQAVNASVAGSLNGQNRIACVAMDYMASDANGGKPFTRFLIFGPSGQLMPSVNLDGRGEKFVPGACLVCHGGDDYAGRYPNDGKGAADVGGHWLPYDIGNFAFSTGAGLTDAAQEAAIYQMNQNVLGTAPTAATQSLIAAWYAGGPPLDQNYVPPAWANSTNPYAVQTYTTMIARSCRTCHSALSSYNWDALGPGALIGYYQFVCGGSPNKGFNHVMPNSLVTFNRFWNSVGTTNAQGASTDQPGLFADMVNYPFASPPLPSGCLLDQGPQ